MNKEVAEVKKELSDQEIQKIVNEIIDSGESIAWDKGCRV